MGGPDNNQKFIKLRGSYPQFVYEQFTIEQNPAGLTLTFLFRVGQQYTFRPTLHFESRSFPADSLLSDTARSMAFHIGMVEMISYWKAFCCPEIIIKPYSLNESQQAFWHKLFYHGLGEFFYTNDINPDAEKLFSFSFENNSPALPAASEEKGRNNAVIIPVGGGKDSVVTLELLKQRNYQTIALVINPREATRRVISIAACKDEDVIHIQRHIDPLLLQLNDQGFLNGHTPFSALLAFVSSYAAYAYETGHIALSNESSANEPSIPGTGINHQYSKSFEFEKDFRAYYRQHILKNNNYFSFLRPLNELQIAAIFSTFKKYHTAFRSCNAGSKTDAWCCNCPKCLFTAIMLLPFSGQQPVSMMLGEDILKKTSLIKTLDELTGVADNKPFECVGTVNEVNAALSQFILQHAGKHDQLPPLLQHYTATTGNNPANASSFEELLNDFNHDHFLDEALIRVLKQALYHIQPHKTIK
jgi:UDP-N-acetyl-alpha-D-muramoyl-L-alanyl-L-glutamate epimerase